jgi:hypothetical protein
MARLAKRTAPDIPKPLPPRGEEESNTTLCKGSDMETPKTKSEPLLGWCKNCNSAANSWTDRLCYACHKLAAGFTFDEDTKIWVKLNPKKGKK